ncbi:MAG: hypothetical protein AVDCRST_MAG01-01-299 [uncultured Rubrobacteraceae bacterium]|uniref:Uncharacterized protein n=1 Tax=uncultured Rubrobacteraceae bacterium TaxID=349277 RepID=A0A6J4NG11_9ACTN|nr:MAG: hypothetical protein AVDCRST_MAG01-01-299 [uncultured Rubrobacteraceae bacterium]
MLLYFSAPLFSEVEKTFKERLTARLEDEGPASFYPSD